MAGVAVLTACTLAAWTTGVLDNPLFPILWGVVGMMGVIHAVLGFAAAGSLNELGMLIRTVPRYALWKFRLYLRLSAGGDTGGYDRARGGICRRAMMNSIQLVCLRVCPDGGHFDSIRCPGVRLKQINTGGNRYRAVTLDEFLTGVDPAQRHPGKRVLITFDDGYEDNYTHAFPVLREFGLPAVVFLVADFSRRTNWWDTPLGVPEAQLLTPNQINRMAGNGIEFGSHTLTHRSLPGASEAELKAEV
jgi:hypothetical protein